MNTTSHIHNYDTKENRKWTLLATSIACSSISTILVSVRLYVRLKILHSAGWDDLCAALATVSSALLWSWVSQYLI